MAVARLTEGYDGQGAGDGVYVHQQAQQENSHGPSPCSSSVDAGYPAPEVVGDHLLHQGLVADYETGLAQAQADHHGQGQGQPVGLGQGEDGRRTRDQGYQGQPSFREPKPREAMTKVVVTPPMPWAASR